MSSTVILRRMHRPRQVWLGGVSAGLAEHLGWPVAAIRAGFVALSAAFGAGLLLYTWLWALTPLESSAQRPDPRIVQRRVPLAASLLGLALIVTVIEMASGRDVILGPLVLAAALAAAAAVSTVTLDRRDPSRSEREGLILRLLAGMMVLALAGYLAIGSARIPMAHAVAAVLLLVLGALILLGPPVAGALRERLDRRADRERRSERSEIAAHLHDSVMQTLAVIQHRAGPSSEIARIARAQERELRDWLYAGSATETADLAAQLRAIAAELELDHPVRFDLVAAGGVADPVPGELVAAAREAMLNAARHAGGEVSVYVEDTPLAIDVFIRDHGPGFDPADLPAGRFGVRESIIARMERSGGRAEIVRRGGADAGEGIEVRLHLDREGVARERRSE